jgi:hypothetical protein
MKDAWQQQGLPPLASEGRLFRERLAGTVAEEGFSRRVFMFVYIH